MIKLKHPLLQNPRTFLLLQEVDGPLQDGGLVHFAWVALALQHGAQLLNEHIELVSPFLLGFIPGCPADTHEKKRLTGGHQKSPGEKKKRAVKLYRQCF